MSLPSFPGDPKPSAPDVPGPGRGGAGDHLPTWLLALCGACTAVATGLSVMSIALQLKNYRMPALQRCVVRIMVMVPLYALSSFISLYSLNAAFFIDAVRDLYEGFVIYTFLQLLITYLGGERDLLLRLRGRPPIPHTFPLNIFFPPMDPSDPWTLLNLKRGVLQYVQIKPILVIITAVCKWTGSWREGEFTLTSGYTYVTIVYNISICLSLYCLAMFWMAVNKDLKPFRPVPKFLCVKGILFFSFWQGVFVGFLLTTVGPYTDPEHMTLAIVDSMICIEMPFFAVAHQYAFQASDYIDASVTHVARLPFIYAARDAFGFKDVWEDIKYTFRARGVSYKAYEAADGGLHYGAGRQKRIRAGLRYSRGGKAKYWLNVPEGEGERQSLVPKTGPEAEYHADYDSSDSEMSDAPSLDFSSASEGEDALYVRARRVGYAGFPNIDVTREQERRRRFREEEGILAGRRFRRGTASENSPGGEASGSASGSSSAAGSAPGSQRRSAKNRRADKGKGKSRAGMYGQWADEGRPSSQPVLVETEVEDAMFDGENENPGAWRAAGTEGGLSLRWTPKVGAKGKQPSHSPAAPSTPTEVVPQPASPPKDGEMSPVAQRPDAVDLVSEDMVEDEETRRRSSSAARHSPNGPDVRLVRSPHSERGSQRSLLHAASPPRQLDPAPPSPAAPTEPDRSPARSPSPPPKLEVRTTQTLKHDRIPVPVSPPRPKNDAPPSPAKPPPSPAKASWRAPSYGRWEDPGENPWA